MSQIVMFIHTKLQNKENVIEPYLEPLMAEGGK